MSVLLPASTWPKSSILAGVGFPAKLIHTNDHKVRSIFPFHLTILSNDIYILALELDRFLYGQVVDTITEVDLGLLSRLSRWLGTTVYW